MSGSGNGRNDVHPVLSGSWTERKLDVVEDYLRAFTTVFKNQHWAYLVYVDAFAGTGRIMRELNSDDDSGEDAREFMHGSALRALQVEDRAFDRFVFVESQIRRQRELARLRALYPDRTIDVVQDDGNLFLQGLGPNSCGRQSPSHSDWRGVLFVDPFGTQVDWTTVEHIASLERLDMWLLVSLMGLSRMLPRARTPDEVDPRWVERLNRVFGDESWRGVYDESEQLELLGTPATGRLSDPDLIMELYKAKLRSAFGNRLLGKSGRLRSSTNSPLFELIFCVGSPSPAAIRAAKRIAGHLIDGLV